MNLNPVVLSIPIYFLLIGIELLIQQFSRKKMYRLNDAVTNISCGITQQLTGLFFKIFSIGVYQYIFENFAVFIIPSNPLTLILLFIFVDFAYYWAHRMSHEVNIMWGAHIVHHQSEDYNLSVALRQSSFQVFWTFAFYLPLAVLGFKTLDFALMAALTTVYQFWIHTPVIKRMGWLEYILNTPSHHRVHHGRDPKYIDKNHAGVFITWDKMFGTFQKEEEPPTYGVTRPLKSWNPVWANFDHYTRMVSEMKSISGWGDKLRFILNKPGWYPKEMGGYQPAPPIDKGSYRKFDTPNSRGINYYVLYQYTIALIGTAFFLFNQASFLLSEKILFATLIIFQVVICGALFENKSWVLQTERIRIIIYSALSIYFSYLNMWNPVLLYAGIIYFIISFLALTFLKNQVHEQASN
jgi:sterol desaturase/sphingolipid hydroxylase (fatty acid hydroxylase superfamily)